MLGYSTATDLGILCVDPMGTLGMGDCNAVDDTFLGELKAKYPSVFQGIGKLKVPLKRSFRNNKVSTLLTSAVKFFWSNGARKAFF